MVDFLWISYETYCLKVSLSKKLTLSQFSQKVVSKRNNTHQIGLETSSYFSLEPLRSNAMHNVGHHKHHLHGEHNSSTPFLQPHGPTITIAVAAPPCIFILKLLPRSQHTNLSEQPLQQLMRYLFHCSNHGCSFVKHQCNTPKRRSSFGNNDHDSRRRPPLMNLRQQPQLTKLHL